SFHDLPPPHIYTLSLHDALPISSFYWHFHSWHHRYTQDPARDPELMFPKATNRVEYLREISGFNFWLRRAIDYPALAFGLVRNRSEEHTSELQSRSDLVCRLLLE